MKPRTGLDSGRRRNITSSHWSSHWSGHISSTWSPTETESRFFFLSKIRTRASKIASVFRSLTRNGPKRDASGVQQSREGHRAKSVFSSGVSKMPGSSSSDASTATVIRRRPPGIPDRAWLNEILRGQDASPPSPSASSQSSAASHHTAASEADADDSDSCRASADPTGETSPDRLPGDREAGMCSSRKRHRRSTDADSENASRPGTRRRLTAAQTAPPHHPGPTIVTVERAAAAKSYFETYYEQALAPGPSPREARMERLMNELTSRASVTGAPLSRTEIEQEYARLCGRESNHLRETRVMKARSSRRLLEPHTDCQPHLADEYQTIQTLGQGSYGRVNLVKDRAGRVFAMKVIRKDTRLGTGEEGHLRTERDFLVASVGSRWIVQLFASFQDVSNLCLVMEFMPGADFLELLMRVGRLDECRARFYFAEMILCIEAVHSLGFIHRDIKPDNFLISASGHLKIGDFGLAYDGHWSHHQSYYASQRYGLLYDLGVEVEGDEEDKAQRSRDATLNRELDSGITPPIKRHIWKDPHNGEKLLDWRRRCGNRASANSAVGTSAYMAPEVIAGERYDGRCDWWSAGIILYECIYGHTPFVSAAGREQTRRYILDWRNTIHFPESPRVSSECRYLMRCLLNDKRYRVCTTRYTMQDWGLAGPGPGSVPEAKRLVFPDDARDIKTHPWFHGVNWERLHEVIPPWIPRLQSVEDTKYFKGDDGPITEPQDAPGGMAAAREPPAMPECQAGPQLGGPLPAGANPQQGPQPGTLPRAKPNCQQGPQSSMRPPPPPLPRPLSPANGVLLPRLPSPSPPSTLTEKQARFLCSLRPGMRAAVQEALDRLKNGGDPFFALNKCMEEVGPGVTTDERNRVLDFLLQSCEPEEKEKAKQQQQQQQQQCPPWRRPQDKLMRDQGTVTVATYVRKRTAFLGYEWRRPPEPEPRPFVGGCGGCGNNNNCAAAGSSSNSNSTTSGLQALCEAAEMLHSGLAQPRPRAQPRPECRPPPPNANANANANATRGAYWRAQMFDPVRQCVEEQQQQQQQQQQREDEDEEEEE